MKINMHITDGRENIKFINWLCKENKMIMEFKRNPNQMRMVCKKEN